MTRAITIGSRGSNLALVQTRHVADLLRKARPGLEVRIEIIATTGDEVLDAPLSQIGGKGLFTKELETAQLDGRVDMAVHSLKDLPTDRPGGLVIAAVSKRATPLDALVFPNGDGLDGLPKGARVGTSSLRRKAQLLAARPDLDVQDLRGNVETRLRKVREGQYDAAVLACAGLERIGRMDAVAAVLPVEVMVPACGQGALALQTREDRPDLIELLRLIHDADAECETTAERSFLAALGGGCHAPIGALARIKGETLAMTGCVCGLDGRDVVRVWVSGARGDAAGLGREAAEQALKGGAEALIAAIGGEG